MSAPRPPCLLHEDDDLLALAKPAGVNTHRPSEQAQDGIHEWAEARWGKLALHHRLDKYTSGVLVMARSPRGSKHLTALFEGRDVAKRYVFYTQAREGRPRELQCDDRIAKPRAGLAALDPRGVEAHTDFTLLERRGDWDLVEARPRTGRTHQIRLHAARLDMPILGDRLYGGAPAARLFLHARSLGVTTIGGAPLELEAKLPPSFDAVADARPTSLGVSVTAALEARELLLEDTDAFRWLDGAPDGVRDLRVEKLGDVALVLRGEEGPVPRELLEALLAHGARAVVERVRPKDPREGEAASVKTLAGTLASPRFEVRENGLRYLVDLAASVTSTGIFLDQRETRRRLAAMKLEGKTLLNAFAHAGAFSVAAAAAGAVTTSLDLSKRYLEWAKENLVLNGHDAAKHDFIYGDAQDWLRRLGKKGRRWDVVVLDPPSFSTSKKGKTWSAARDLGSLVALGLSCLAPGGTLYVSTNQRGLLQKKFQEHVEAGFREAGRPIASLELTTLPLDFRTLPGEPPYLKAAWAS
ncbi:MAG: pseudouridine synthase [Planctomycetota bacterium]